MRGRGTTSHDLLHSGGGVDRENDNTEGGLPRSVCNIRGGDAVKFVLKFCRTFANQDAEHLEK